MIEGMDLSNEKKKEMRNCLKQYVTDTEEELMAMKKKKQLLDDLWFDYCLMLKINYFELG